MHYIYMIFDKNIVNTGRQTEMDLARGFAALVIVMCHVGLYIGNEMNTAVYTFADIIGSEPAAPVFMTLMGVGVMYSRHREPKLLLFRGIRLFIGGFLLSAFRSLLPYLIFGNIDEWTAVASFFAVDIFQFAGLAFMFSALLKKLKVPTWGILIIALVMVAVGQIFIANPPDITNEYLIYFLNLFIPITEWSCFPFLTWFFFPAFGMVFGELLLHCREKKKFYGIMLPVSSVGVAYVYILFYSFYPAYAENYYFGGNYYYMGIKNVLLTALIVSFIISFWYFADKIPMKFIKRFLLFLGRNITVFYVFTWIFISVIIHVSAKLSVTYNSVMTIVIMLVVTAISYAATYMYLLIKKKAITDNHKQGAN